MATPPSSLGASEACTCSIHGSVAVTVAVVFLTPGEDVVGEARVGGEGGVEAARPRSMLSSALGSSATSWVRLVDCAAKARRTC